MPVKPDKPNNFWQELKRRKVFRVLAIYAGTAYIIIEIVDNISEPLHLPVWFATLIILLLAIGFPVAAILAWIFDFTSEGIVKTEAIREPEKKEPPVRPSGKRRFKVSDFIIAGLLIIVIVMAWPKIFSRNSLEHMMSSDGRISVAVMPFQNMTNDTTWDVWQGGIQNELIASLTNSEELKVRQAETVNSLMQGRGITNYASIAPSVASKISKTLDANILINGNINQAGNTVRVNAQLVNPRNDEIIKSFRVESPDREEMVFDIIDSLSAQVKDFLVISKMRKESPHNYDYSSPTNSPEAYRLFTYGQKAFFNSDFNTAIKYYSQAIAIDSGFYNAIRMMSAAYSNMGQYDHAKKWCLEIYDKRNQMDIGHNILSGWLYAMLFETPNEEIKFLNQLLELDDQSAPTYYELGRIYVALDQYDKSITVMNKAFDIYKKWEVKPRWVQDYIMLGFAYQQTGQYRKAKKLYKNAEKDFPGTYYVPQRQAILALTEKDTIAAEGYIETCRSLSRELFSSSEVNINFGLAYIYIEGGYLDKAESCYRTALGMEPENTSCLNNLGCFLIHHDRNIEEGMELLEQALAIRPDSYIYLANKGEGLYKQGKYDEALELLQRSWQIRARYNHASYLMIEEVKKAISGQ
ncbi:MAG: tetratricopeptide repeat protein [Bacteroidales bacterium]|nr:tetratricopeptide repeat protein [Bacteroidales bacterium]